MNFIMLKNLTIFIAVVLYQTGAFTQITRDTVYYDNNWNQTSHENARYFRLIEIDTTRILFFVKDFYIDKIPQMQGAYRSINPDVKIGDFIYWYHNGQEKIKCHFENGYLEGPYYEWYENGILKSEKNYIRGKLDGMVKIWNNKGILNKNVEYKNGLKHGQFLTYYDNGQPVRKDIYKNDVMIRGKCFTPEGKDTVYFDYFTMPEFNGGLKGFKNFILEKLTYPDTARLNDEEGNVHVRFTVGKDGHVKGINVIKGDKVYFNEEVIHAVASSPEWIPGRRDGKVVDVTITIPVKFKLE